MKIIENLKPKKRKERFQGMSKNFKKILRNFKKKMKIWMNLLDVQKKR